MLRGNLLWFSLLAVAGGLFTIFVCPYLRDMAHFPICFFALGVLATTVLNPVAAVLNGRFESVRSALTDSAQPNTPESVWLRQGDDRNQMVIHARDRATVNGLVRLRGESVTDQPAGLLTTLAHR